MDDIHLRVKYLERVVSNMLTNKPMSTKKNKGMGGEVSPPTDEARQGESPVSFKLKYPKSEIKDPRSGKLVVVTEEKLRNDKELLQHMITKHADCFTEINLDDKSGETETE